MSIQNPIPLESIQADEAKAHERAQDDVLTRVLEDHAEIKGRAKGQSWIRKSKGKT